MSQNYLKIYKLCASTDEKINLSNFVGVLYNLARAKVVEVETYKKVIHGVNELVFSHILNENEEGNVIIPKEKNSLFEQIVNKIPENELEKIIKVLENI